MCEKCNHHWSSVADVFEEDRRHPSRRRRRGRGRPAPTRSASVLIASLTVAAVMSVVSCSSSSSSGTQHQEFEIRHLAFEDFYAEDPDDVAAVERWKPAVELAAMAYRAFSGRGADTEQRQSREFDDDEVPAAATDVPFFSATDDDNSTTADALALAASFGSGNTTAGTPSLRRPTDDDHRRCPGAHTTTTSAVDGGGVGGRRQKRQLLPGLFFDETSEHPFIILLQYVVPLISIDLPVLLPPNIKNIDRSKPTLAGAFQMIP